MFPVKITGNFYLQLFLNYKKKSSFDGELSKKIYITLTQILLPLNNYLSKSKLLTHVKHYSKANLTPVYEIGRASCRERV